MIKYHDLPPEAFAVIYRKKMEFKITELVPDKPYIKGLVENTFEEKLFAIEHLLTEGEKKAAESFRKAANKQIHRKIKFDKDFFISDYLTLNHALNRLLKKNLYLDDEYIKNGEEVISQEDAETLEKDKRINGQSPEQPKPEQEEISEQIIIQSNLQDTIQPPQEIPKTGKTTGFGTVLMWVFIPLFAFVIFIAIGPNKLESNKEKEKSTPIAATQDIAPSKDLDNKIYQVVDEAPQYPGGDSAMAQFMGANLDYPDFENINKIQGRVLMSLVVNTDGSLQDITVKKGVSAGLDKEAMRVMKLIPKFNPGKINGKAVRTLLPFSITFGQNSNASDPLSRPGSISQHTIEQQIRQNNIYISDSSYPTPYQLPPKGKIIINDDQTPDPRR